MSDRYLHDPVFHQWADMVENALCSGVIDLNRIHDATNVGASHFLMRHAPERCDEQVSANMEEKMPMWLTGDEIKTGTARRCPNCHRLGTTDYRPSLKEFRCTACGHASPAHP